MARCLSCGEPLPEDRERAGSRCPRCHDPLYEPPTRFSRPAREDEAACAVHAGMESVGMCGRCGNYLCETCRTRWRGQIWCAACVSRALEAGEGAPEQERAHLRQALLSLVFGGSAWLVGFGALVVVGAAAAASGAPSLAAATLAFLVLAADIALAALGLGQATAALRTRGNHMILATIGLILSGLYPGMLMGLMAFSLWQN